MHRGATVTNSTPLVSAVVNGVPVTTEPGIRQWILAQSRQPGRAEAPKPADEQRRRARTEARLDALGLR